MSNSDIAFAYALAKTLGFDKSLDDFQTIFKTTYENALKDLSNQTPPAKVEVVHNPLR